MVAANFPWLSVLVAVPAAGAALLGFVPPLRRAAGRVIALACALVELALGLVAAVTVFDWSAPLVGALTPVADSFGHPATAPAAAEGSAQ